MNDKVQAYLSERGVKTGNIQDTIVDAIDRLHEEAGWHLEVAIGFVDELVVAMLD